MIFKHRHDMEVVMMRSKRWILAGISVLVMSGSAIGFVAAQESTPEVPPVIEELRNRGYLGVTLTESENGVEVVAVLENSPAADAGLQAGDVITTINGVAVATPREAQRAIRDIAADEVVMLEIIRDSETQTLEATLTGLPENFDARRGAMGLGRDTAFTFDPETGVFTVARLSEDNPLYEAGFREGDMIVAVDGETRDLAALAAYVISLEDDATVMLTIERNGEAQDITVAVNELALFRGERGFFRNMVPNGERGEGFGMRSMAAGVRLGVGFEMTDAGATVTAVLEGAPAAEAGLLIGDMITAVNGEAVNEEITLRDRVSAYEAGDVVTLAVTRDGKALALSVTLVEPMEMRDMIPFFNSEGRGGRGGMRGNGGQPDNAPNAPADVTPPVEGASA